MNEYEPPVELLHLDYEAAERQAGLWMALVPVGHARHDPLQMAEYWLSRAEWLRAEIRRRS